MLLENINEVIKASPAIQIQGKMTHLQRRAWNVLLANAYNELPNKDIHSVSIVELAAKLGFESKNEEYLKETLEALGACQVKWNLLNKDKKEKWGFANLLASARIASPHICARNSTTLVSILNSISACKTGSRANTLSFYGKSVSTTSIPTAVKAKHLSFPLKFSEN